MREALYWIALIGRVESDKTEDVPSLLAEGKEIVAILMSSAKTARDRD